MQAAWERVEAKLDRLGEVQAEHGRLLAQLDRRIDRVEGDLDMVKLMLERLRHEIERRAERLKDELLTELGRETGVVFAPAQALSENGLSAGATRAGA